MTAGINVKSIKTWSETTAIDPVEGFDCSYIKVQSDSEGKDSTEAIMCGKCGNKRFYISFRCDMCGSSFAVFSVREQFRNLAKNPVEGKDRTWFHVTGVVDWYKVACEKNLSVHIGSMETVQSIIQERYSEGQQYYIWELSMEDANVAYWVCPDIEQAWVKNSNEFTAKVGYDFVGYVNIFEAPGSISFIGNPHKLKVVGMK